jgi:hypothetical protein
MTLRKHLQYRQAKQLSLFQIETESHSLPQDNGSSAFNDPAFARNKTLPVHRWVPWIAGFSSDFVRDALQRYLADKGTVLDPFSGVGTTLGFVKELLPACHSERAQRVKNPRQLNGDSSASPQNDMR